METLSQHFDWVNQLVALLGIHTKHLSDLEDVKFYFYLLIKFM